WVVAIEACEKLKLTAEATQENRPPIFHAHPKSKREVRSSEPNVSTVGRTGQWWSSPAGTAENRAAFQPLLWDLRVPKNIAGYDQDSSAGNSSIGELSRPTNVIFLVTVESEGPTQNPPNPPSSNFTPIKRM